jgi:hypothetical protein
MPNTATIHKADGTDVPIAPKNGTHFQLDELRAAIGGGYIEHVTLADGRAMICDEEGHLKGLPLNKLASVLYYQAGGVPGCPVVGDVLVCDPGMIR